MCVSTFAQQSLTTKCSYQVPKSRRTFPPETVECVYAIIRLSVHRCRIHNVLGNLVRGSVGHPVTFTPAFDLPIMAASHNCQHIDIVVTLRVVSGRQSPPVFKSRSPACRVRTFLLWRLLCINRWSCRNKRIGRFIQRIADKKSSSTNLFITT